MKKFSEIMVTILLIIASLAFISCASNGSRQQAEQNPSVQRLTIAGGTIGGSSNLAANAMAVLIKTYCNIDTTVINYPTQAQVQGCVSGNSDIATAMTDLSYDAYTATGTCKDAKPTTELRILFYTWDTPLQIFVPVDSNIKTFRDLIGKRICTGQVGFSADLMFQKICKTLGLNYQKDFTIVPLGQEDAGSAMAAGKIDVYVANGSFPHPTMTQTDMIRPLTLVSITEEDAKAVIKDYPYYNMTVVQPKYYHMTSPTLILNTLGDWVTTTKLSEDVGYRITKAYFENPKLLSTYIASLGDVITTGMMKGWIESSVPVPLQAGSYKYFKEQGWNLPANSKPPEVK